jgi:hypothetical protein
MSPRAVSDAQRKEGTMRKTESKPQRGRRRTDMNRKAKTQKPLAWGTLGVPFHTSVGNFSDGFYWFATQDVQMFRRVIQNDPDAMAAQEWHGPFKTRAEAAKAAEIGIAGENCKLEHRRHVGPELGKAAMNFTRRPNAAAPTEPRIACHASEAEHRNR